MKLSKKEALSNFDYYIEECERDDERSFMTHSKKQVQESEKTEFDYEEFSQTIRKNLPLELKYDVPAKELIDYLWEQLCNS